MSSFDIQDPDPEKGPALKPSERLSTMLSRAGYQTVVRRYTPHQHLYFDKDPRTGVYEVLSGTVIQYVLLSDARRRIEAFSRPGHLLAFGVAELHEEHAEALTDARVSLIPRAVFDAALCDVPHFRDAVFRRIEQMLVEARAQTALAGWKTARQSTASFLLFLEARFRDPVTGIVRIPMTRRDIADYLGLTLETVSRMIGHLKRAGAIDLLSPAKFTVLDRDMLVAEAGNGMPDSYWRKRVGG